MKKYIAVSTMAFMLPLVAFAQKKTLATLIDVVVEYLNKILLLLMGVAVVMFVWYIIQYFIKPNADRKDAGLYVMYSIIGFFIILSFWGIVNVLQNTFGLQNTGNAPSTWSDLKNFFPTPNGGNNNPNGGLMPPV